MSKCKRLLISGKSFHRYKIFHEFVLQLLVAVKCRKNNTELNVVLLLVNPISTEFCKMRNVEHTFRSKYVINYNRALCAE